MRSRRNQGCFDHCATSHHGFDVHQCNPCLPHECDPRVHPRRYRKHSRNTDRLPIHSGLLQRDSKLCCYKCHGGNCHHPLDGLLHQRSCDSIKTNMVIRARQRLAWFTLVVTCKTHARASTKPPIDIITRSLLVGTFLFQRSSSR